MAAVGEDIEWIANRLFIPASLLAFLTGVLLVIEPDFYGFGDDWIVIALVLYATTFLAGLLFLGPESGTVKPDFGDVGSWVWALVGAAISVGIIVWRYRVALAQGGPPPRAEAA